MINKVKGWLAVSVACLMVFGLLMTSCEKDKDTEIVLNSFGPSPVLRGGDLKFIGNNLDQVTAVVLPDNINVTTFVSKTSGLLVITVPEATVNGKVTLKTPQGDIVTKTLLKISEPIAIESITPMMARPGEVITIAGTYLNLVKEVIFTKNKTVTSFESQTKTELQVKIPADAQTGTIVLSNGEAEPIEIETVKPVIVVLPEITQLSPNPVKAGTLLTLQGTDLDLVRDVILGGGKKVTEFVSKTESKIELTVPADAKDGKIKLVVASEVEVESAAELVMVIPVIAGIAPNPVENGQTLTVTGTDLDLITGATFGGGKSGTLLGGTATEIRITVPLDATEGPVTFRTAAGKSVTSVQLGLLMPTIISLSPLELKANTSLTITGTEFDIVVAVVFTGGNRVTVSNATETEIVVTVPSGTLSGPVILVTTNGTEITSAESLTILASNVPLITSMPLSMKPGQMITIIGEKLDLLTDVIFPGEVKATMFGEKTATKLEVVVPMTVAKGKGKIRFVTFENEFTESPEVMISGVDPVVDPTLVYFNFDGKNSWWGDAGGPENDPALSLDGTNYWRVNRQCSGWTGLFWRNGKNDFPADRIGTDVDKYVVKFDINTLEPMTGGQLRLRFNGTEGDFWYLWAPWAESGSYTTDGWITVTIPITDFRDQWGSGSNKPTDMSKVDADFGMAFDGGASMVNICVDNMRFELVE
ncbi:MAG: glycan-binding surface protein [Bacteroidota bacterium]